MNIRQCWDFLNIKDAPRESDVIFVLGGASVAPVHRAYELYKKGFAPKIAFISTGGNFGGEKIWGVPENQKYRDVLLEFGDPRKISSLKDLPQIPWRRRGKQSHF